MTATLEKDIQTFERILPSIINQEGKYALIFDAQLIGVFDTYADALSAGYSRAELNPFLVKKIAGVENVANLSRDINQCPIMPSS
jgi:hypothetical protein